MTRATIFRQLTKFTVSYYLIVLISPRRSRFTSPRHNRQCELNDYGGGHSDGSDDSDGSNSSNDHDTHQHVYNTCKRCIRNHPRPRVHASPQSAKPSTTPIGEQHHPMETVRKFTSTLGMRTIHVCLPYSPSPNQPSLYQQRSTRLCKSHRWNHPGRNDTLPSTDTPS